MKKQILRISEAGQKVIDSYLKMSINGKIITCPYFTNIKRERAGLKVFLGKGSAQEIIDEVNFIALKEQVSLEKFSEQDLYRFLIMHDLGIDCSGLTVHVLQALYREQSKIDILKKIKIIPFFKNPWRYLLCILRPVENISVRVLANDKNSFQVDSFNKAKSGDMLIRTDLRHIYLITEVEKENNMVKKISYIHAPRPRQKDYFGPGIFQNTIFLQKGTLDELDEKLNNQIIIRRLKF